MSKRTCYTKVTGLPRGITREVVMETLMSHVEMIDLNPLIEERHPCKPPSFAPAEEFHCQWYEITDKVQYLPAGLYSGHVKYYASFHNLSTGIQTHCYAPLGLHIRGKWTLGGSLPHEPKNPVELGIDVPKEGLYIREDVDLRCNFLATKFVKKTLQKAHAQLVLRIIEKAHLSEAEAHNASILEQQTLHEWSQPNSPLNSPGMASQHSFPRPDRSSRSDSISQRSNSPPPLTNPCFSTHSYQPLPLFAQDPQQQRLQQSYPSSPPLYASDPYSQTYQQQDYKHPYVSPTAPTFPPVLPGSGGGNITQPSPYVPEPARQSYQSLSNGSAAGVYQKHNPYAQEGRQSFHSAHSDSLGQHPAYANITTGNPFRRNPPMQHMVELPTQEQKEPAELPV